MKADYVVWDEENKVILEVARDLNKGETHEVLQKKVCVCLEACDIKERYGMWYSYDPQKGVCNYWEHLPYEHFPKEFKTALLLQGIT